MARLYVDEHFPLPTVSFLRELGHDVLSPTDTGMRNQGIPDEEVLRLAIELNRAVVTMNKKHFVRLHARNADHQGIITCTADADFEALAKHIDEIVAVNQTLAGKLLRVTRKQS